MTRRLVLRLRHLLPFPLSFRLASHLPKPMQSCLPGPCPHQASVPEATARGTKKKPRQSAGRRRRRQLHATSYLDGLRGLAALVVCLCHYTEENHPDLTSWYGVFPNPAVPLAPSWIQLPFVRVLFSGRPMVHVFFIVSGFALSVRALAAARARDLARCHAILASAAFRRPLRLCGPPVVSMAMIFLLVRAGWLGPPAAAAALPTWRRQLDDWVAAVYYHVIWPWSWDAHLYPPYNVNLWTVPVELCHSMLLFLTILTLSRMATAARVASALVFVVYCLHCGKWAAAEFIAGMLLAEAHLVSAERGGGIRDEGYLPLSNLSSSSSSSSSPPPLDDPEVVKEVDTSVGNTRGSSSTARRRLETLLHTAILTAALYVAGWPNVDSTRTPGIRHLVSHTPGAFDRHDPQAPQKFWFALVAMGTVWSCGRVAFVRRTILESCFAQYAGRISFAVYIIHGPGWYFQMWKRFQSGR
ncbi:hypothetical protein F5B17DRAFT_440676 [Nemania serpens]|nr:hypothetical protein F5B17DRAFT_440676 [Nemania serpens]